MHEQPRLAAGDRESAAGFAHTLKGSSAQLGARRFSLLCAELKADERFCDIPVILLTAVASHVTSTRYSHRDGIGMEADDYISKPFELDELMVRVKTVLQRAKAMRDLSPLTGLPGNFRITQELERRTERGEPYALVHADLDNFKAFNDHYGFMRGDSVIKFTAATLMNAAAASGDSEAFVGHVGGDDFISMLDPGLV